MSGHFLNLNYSGTNNNVINAINDVSGILNDIIVSPPEGKTYNAYISEANFNDSSILGTANPYTGNIILNSTFSGNIFLNTVYKHGYNSILLHEVLHVLGLIINTDDNNVGDNLIDINGKRYYKGTNGVSGYNNVLSQNSITDYTHTDVSYIPIEDGGGAGTTNSHCEEGASSIEMRDRVYPILQNEIMTGI